MASKQEWEQEAERFDKKAQKYYEAGDLGMAEYFWQKASSCLVCAVYAVDAHQ